MTTSRVDVLARIASGLCREARIARVERSPDGTWSWNGATRVLRVGARALDEAGPDVCAGIVAHEVGHAHISRGGAVSALASRRGVEVPAALVGMWRNAVEDPRVEVWMARRFPGVAPWLARARAEGLRRIASPPVLRHDQWALGACIDDAPEGARLVSGMLPEVRAALGATRFARRTYRDAFLPPVAVDRREALAPPPGGGPPDAGGSGPPVDRSPRERLVRALAAQAASHAAASIFPTVIALFDADVDEVAGVLCGDPDLAAVVVGRTHGLPHPADVVAVARRGGFQTSEPDAAARREAARWLGLALAGEAERGTSLGAGWGQPAPLLDQAPRPGALLEAELALLTPSTQQLAARLEDALRASLRPVRRAARVRPDAGSGLRADLRRLMDAEARAHVAGRVSEDVWRRPVPARHAAAAALLIDCSASMVGVKIHAALQAADVFARALHGAEVPYLVSGFQDRAFPLADWGAPLAIARQAIAGASLEVVGRRPGGNNRPRSNDDGPALLATAELLLRLPADQHVLVVLSDGRPLARPDAPADLRAAVLRLTAQGVDVIGIGVGEQAEAVRGYYPRHVVVPSVEALPEELVRVLGG